MCSVNTTTDPGRVWAILHQPESFSRRSGLVPLVEALNAKQYQYTPAWEQLQKKSWTAGYLLRKTGNLYYGSGWNALVPFWDEWRMRMACPRHSPFIAHFLWAEFAGPKNGAWIRRRGGRVVGTFHCSARRQTSVLGRRRRFGEYDWIVLMSETQRPFFVQKGFPSERISVILHGVDSDFYRPSLRLQPASRGSLRALMVGSTERDHEFLARVLKLLPPECLTLDVFCHPSFHLHYKNIPCAKIHKHCEDKTLRSFYQGADLLLMPMLDCTANNAILESMACGTPVMINRTGGVCEYVDEKSNIVMKNKVEREWADCLVTMWRNRQCLELHRHNVREWAEQFTWSNVAEKYKRLYERLLHEGGESAGRYEIKSP